MANFLTLDLSGLISATILGLLLLFFGGSMGWFFLASMIVFLVLSAAVTEYRKDEKKEIGVNEKARSWKNVVANGTVPLIVVIFYYLNHTLHFTTQEVLLIIYLSSLSAVIADKFASELGVLNGKPIMLLTLKEVDRGTSGGVTALGITGGLIASMVIGLLSLFMQGSLGFFIVIVVAGFFGNIVDSIFGYFEEKGLGNKFTSNMACAAAAALFSYVLLIL